MTATRCREPLQYVVNCSHWRSYRLAVGPGVLIPRQETGVLVDLALQVTNCCSKRLRLAGLLSCLAHGSADQAAEAEPWLREGAWADLGTGSGALALGLTELLTPGGKAGMQLPQLLTLYLQAAACMPLFSSWHFLSRTAAV